MSQPKHDEAGDVLLLSRIAHVVERAGLAMAGAMCGTFVAAQLSHINPAAFDTASFIAAMVLCGAIGFYLGIDIPRLRAIPIGPAIARPRVDPVELLSATGTFLAAMAALISVYNFVFDASPPASFQYLVACWFIGGVAMQIGAGLIGRLCAAGRASG